MFLKHLKFKIFNKSSPSHSHYLPTLPTPFASFWTKNFPFSHHPQWWVSLAGRWERFVMWLRADGKESLEFFSRQCESENLLFILPLFHSSLIQLFNRLFLRLNTFCLLTFRVVVLTRSVYSVINKTCVLLALVIIFWCAIASELEKWLRSPTWTIKESSDASHCS